MKSLICYISSLIVLVLQTRAIQLHSASVPPVSYVELADKVSTSITTQWVNHLDSFIDLVSKKMVDNIENEISNSDNDNLLHL
ncbi:gamete egress and sporozoite traversal protein, putative, partial [Hepatocystis sp. ex Piliocolobus tephrosceles]